MIRYLYAWRMWLRAVYIARAKKHGAGKQCWSHALKSAACVHYLIDGQHRNPPRFPRWMRKAIVN